MIKIKQSLTIKDIENLYSHLHQSNEPFNLLLPKQLKSWDFGISTLLIQFICTWLKSNNAGKLVLETDADFSFLEENIKNGQFSVLNEVDKNESYSSLNEIVKADFAFPAIIMAWDRGIFDLKGRNIKRAIRPLNELVIDTMQSLGEQPAINKSFKRQKGLKSLLTCFDHLPPEKGFLDCFYSNKEFIQSENTLAESLEDTLKYILSLNKQGSQNTDPIKKDLVGIIYELMKNTHEWARTDTHSKTLNPNVRGLLMKFIRKGKDNFKENYKYHLGLKNYFDGFRPNSNNDLYFIEISVFDSGVGYIDKYTGRSNMNMPINQQVEIIKNCLIKHNTSAKTLEREHKGLGLDRIMQILDKKGLFMIRTSNAFVFRNMKEKPYQMAKEVKDIDLYDWETSLSNEYTCFNKCIGSNITIVYPIIID